MPPFVAFQIRRESLGGTYWQSCIKRLSFFDHYREALEKSNRSSYSFFELSSGAMITFRFSKQNLTQSTLRLNASPVGLNNCFCFASQFSFEIHLRLRFVDSSRTRVKRFLCDCRRQMDVYVYSGSWNESFVWRWKNEKVLSHDCTLYTLQKRNFDAQELENLSFASLVISRYLCDRWIGRAALTNTVCLVIFEFDCCN